VKGLYLRAMQRSYIRTRKAQVGEIKEQKNRKVHRKEKVTVLLFLTPILQSDLGGATSSIKIIV